MSLLSLPWLAAEMIKKKGMSPHKEAQKIVVATRGTAKPFTYTDDKGNLTGYDVEIASEVETP